MQETERVGLQVVLLLTPLLLVCANEGEGRVKDLSKYVLSAVAVVDIPVHNEHLGKECGVDFSCVG